MSDFNDLFNTFKYLSLLFTAIPGINSIGLDTFEKAQTRDKSVDRSLTVRSVNGMKHV